LVRVLLVPSIMRLLGTATWWVPAPLRTWSLRASAFSEDEAVSDRPLEEDDKPVDNESVA
jgi:RND superfamily putative drug exporter